MMNAACAADVSRLLDTVQRGYLDRDAAAITAHYTGEARIFDLAPPLGRPIDEGVLAQWLSGWAAPVEQEFRDFEFTVRGDVAFAHGLIHVSTRTQEGEDVAWWMRATVCLVREDGAWKIAHEHTSVPFYMDGSFRAALDLSPS